MMVSSFASTSRVILNPSIWRFANSPKRSWLSQSSHGNPPHPPQTHHGNHDPMFLVFILSCAFWDADEGQGSQHSLDSAIAFLRSAHTPCRLVFRCPVVGLADRAMRCGMLNRPRRSRNSPRSLRSRSFRAVEFLKCLFYRRLV
jgi:hypothetical protein